MSGPFDRYVQKGLQHEAQEKAQAALPVTQHHMPGVEVAQSLFERELQDLINRHSMENGSGTPDFILAEFLANMLKVFDSTMQRRANWRDESVDLPALTKPAGKKVPLVDYVDGRRNEIGEAYIQVWPGENESYDRIDSVITVEKLPEEPS